MMEFIFKQEQECRVPHLVPWDGFPSDIFIPGDSRKQRKIIHGGGS